MKQFGLEKSLLELIFRRVSKINNIEWLLTYHNYDIILS